MCVRVCVEHWLVVYEALKIYVAKYHEDNRKQNIFEFIYISYIIDDPKKMDALL